MRFCKLEAAGHEHAAGTGLADPDGDSWVAKLGQMAGIPNVENYAQAGAQYAAVGTAPAVAQQLWANLDRTRRAAPYLSGSALVVLDGARGDVDVYGQPTDTIRDAFKHGLRAAICHARACSVFPANDPDLTYSGSWAAVGADADWPEGVTRAAGANGDYVEVDVPADWPGGYGFIVCPETDDAHGAVFTVTVDGAASGTLDTRAVAITGELAAATLRFAIPASAAGDTVRVTVGSFATAAKFSHIGFEVPTGSGHTNAAPYYTEGYTPPVVVVAKDARPNSYGATSHHDGQWEAYWVYQLDVVNEFNTELVQIADLDGTLNKMAAYFQTVDTFSPSAFGHITIAMALHQYSVLAGPTYIDMAMLALPAPAAPAQGGLVDNDEVIAATPNVISHWPLKDPNGTTAEDLIGGHDGTYNGTFKLNQPGVLLTGGGGFIEVPNVAELQDLEEWTLEIWMLAVNVQSNAALIDSVFSTKINYTLGFSSDGTGDLSAGYYQGGWHTAKEAADTFPDSGVAPKDQHCVGTYDGTTIKLYRNGKLVATTAHSATPTSDAGAKTWIGKASASGTPMNNAVLRDAVICSRPLTLDEIVEHYKAGR